MFFVIFEDGVRLLEGVVHTKLMVSGIDLHRNKHYRSRTERPWLALQMNPTYAYGSYDTKLELEGITATQEYHRRSY